MQSPSRTTHIVTGLRSVPSRRTDARLSSSALPIVSSSSRVQLVIAHLLQLDEELDRLALVHRPVAVRYVGQRPRTVEYPAGLDSAVEDIGQQFLDIGARRGGTAGDSDVVEERPERRRDLLVLRQPDAADRATGTGDAESGDGRLSVADALEHRVGAEPVGELADALDGLVAPLAHDVGRAELPGQSDAVGMAAEQDDPL